MKIIIIRNVCIVIIDFSFLPLSKYSLCLATFHFFLFALTMKSGSLLPGLGDISSHFGGSNKPE